MPKRFTFEEFKSIVYKYHRDTILVDEFEYVNSKSYGKVTCILHGQFEALACTLLKGGRGCKQCQYESLEILQGTTKESFVKKASEKHGDTYDYSLVEYSTNKVHVTIICKLHGPFSMRPDNHCNGNGCPICKRPGLERKMAQWKDDPALQKERINGSFYLLQCTRKNDGKKFLKFGITTTEVMRRYQRRQYDDYEIFLDTVLYMKIDNALKIEKSIKSNFKHYKTDGFLGSGKTECLIVDSYQEVKQYIQSLHAEMHVEKSI